MIVFSVDVSVFKKKEMIGERIMANIKIQEKWLLMGLAMVWEAFCVFLLEHLWVCD